MSRFGSLPPRYNVGMYSGTDRGSPRCPQCDRPMRSRKVPLLVHIAPLQQMVALGKTCRYCPACDFLVVQRYEVLLELAAKFPHANLTTVDDCLPLGTMERRAWRRGMRNPLTIEELRGAMADFGQVFALRMTYEPRETHQ